MVTLAIMIIVGSMVTGGYLILLAVRPWAGSMAAIQDVERNGSRYYKADSRSSALFYEVERASSGIRKNQPKRALEAIKSGERTDPTNPLFVCLRATVYWRNGDKRKAVDAVMAAKDKDTLTLYGSSSVEPVAWQWPEIEMIARTAREMSEDNPDDQRQILSALRMADMVVWSEPPHPVRIMLGLSARHSAARRLRALANRTGDVATRRLCDQLLIEGRMFRNAWSRTLAEADSSSAGEQALAVQRFLREGSHHHNAAAILELDEQAERSGVCRGKYMVKGLVAKAAAKAEERKELNAGK